jgi:membrane protein
MSWVELARRTKKAMDEDEVLGRSGELAYFFLLALFPMLLFLIALLGMVLGPESELRAGLFDYMARVMPKSAYDVVSGVISQTARASSGTKALLGAVLALWSASSGMSAVMRMMNLVYGVVETRSYARSRALAVGLTFGVGALMLLAIAAVLLGGQVAGWLGSAIGVAPIVVPLWDIGQWPLALFFVVVAFGLIYHYGPSRVRPWRWVSRGSVLGVVIWLVGSIGFRVYLSHFNNYSATYGSLGAVIILMLWFYLTGFALLLGAEVDAAVEEWQREQDRSSTMRSHDRDRLPAPVRP